MRDSVGGARAQFFCSGLPDQDQPHYFSTPLYGEDTRTVYSGELMYACNHSSGGVTYLQNMSYIFDYSGGENATTDTGGDIFRLDFSTLPFPRPFPRPSLALCVPRPTLAHATLHAAGTAALRHGYRILRIEFCAQRGVGAECLPRLFACADFSMAANGCRAGLGVNINYTVMVQYPDKVWDSLQQIDKLWPRVKPAVPLLTQVMTVSNATVLDSLTPVFSVASLICPDYAKGDDAKCGAVNQNMSNMLIQTGTNVEIEVKSIEGSSQGPDGGTKDPPGLAFQLESTISFLSSQASGLCQGMKPFCCADPNLEAGCCCTPHEMKAQCKTGMAPFTSDRCAAATGQDEMCSDHMDDPSKPDNGKVKPQKSDCEIFKKGVYNFTIANQAGSGVQGRVNVFPDAAAAPTFTSQLASRRDSVGGNAVMLGSTAGADAAGTVSFDLLQYVFAELCSTTLGNRKTTNDCPGCEKGACWLSGDQTGVDGKGYVKIGNYESCDSITNRLLRAVGAWGVVGIVLLVAALCGGGGYFAFQVYKKKQLEQSAYGESIYKDVVSDAADAALAGSEAESVVR